MGLGEADLGRLWGCKGSASQLVGDALPCSYALYSVIGCMHSHMSGAAQAEEED